MPEPIYRLRLDPRSATVPFENVNDVRRDRETIPAARGSGGPGAASPVADDLRPTDEVAQMVDAERAEGDGEKDLLDSSRPIE